VVFEDVKIAEKMDLGEVETGRGEIGGNDHIQYRPPTSTYNELLSPHTHR